MYNIYIYIYIYIHIYIIINVDFNIFEYWLVTFMGIVLFGISGVLAFRLVTHIC